MAMVVLCAGGLLLVDHTFGQPLKPALEYWGLGGLFGVMCWSGVVSMPLLAARTTWLRGSFYDPEVLRRRNRRLKELQQEREDILKSAQDKLNRVDRGQSPNGETTNGR